LARFSAAMLVIRLNAASQQRQLPGDRLGGSNQL
jgi:hypothetical protein